MTNLAIAGVGYTEAFQVLRDANQYAALHHTRLGEGLARSAGMAGDSSFASAWAASYDDTAALAVAAFEDVVAALGATARLCAGCLDNHVRADLASAALDPGAWPSLRVEHPYEVSSFVPPPSLGGDPSSLPGWANAILDHVEGFVWPDADLDALHAVASVWTGLSDHLDSLAELIARAISHLWGERSPEIPMAIDALGRLRDAVGELAEEAGYLARSCSDYAAAVQAQRDAILDLVHDLLRDAVIIQAAGFLVGLVTAGTANAAAGGLNVAKIAAEGPRFLAMLDHLRDLAYTASLGLNAGATTITGIQTRLGPFVRARLALRSEAGRVRLASAYGRDWMRAHEVRRQSYAERACGQVQSRAGGTARSVASNSIRVHFSRSGESRSRDSGDDEESENSHQRVVGERCPAWVVRVVFYACDRSIDSTGLAPFMTCVASAWFSNGTWRCRRASACLLHFPEAMIGGVA